MKISKISLGKAAILLLLVSAGLSLGACAGKSHNTVGVVVTNLPQGNTIIMVKGVRYHFHDGFYYRPVRGGYRIVVAPIGATVVRLPKHHKVVSYRGNVYYHCRDAYYSWDQRRKVYVVVRSPR